MLSSAQTKDFLNWYNTDKPDLYCEFISYLMFNISFLGILSSICYHVAYRDCLPHQKSFQLIVPGDVGCCSNAG